MKAIEIVFSAGPGRCFQKFILIAGFFFLSSLNKLLIRMHLHDFGKYDSKFWKFTVANCKYWVVGLSSLCGWWNGSFVLCFPDNKCRPHCVRYFLFELVDGLGVGKFVRFFCVLLLLKRVFQTRKHILSNGMTYENG